MSGDYDIAVAAMGNIKRIAAPGQEMSLDDAIDALFDCLSEAMVGARHIERLEQQNAKLREALEPFAAACTISNKEDDCDLDDSIAATKITFGDLRRARAALQEGIEP